MHEARADAHCVMHLHSLDEGAVSAMDGGLLPVTQLPIVVHEDLSSHECEGIALDLAERPRLQADLGQSCSMLLWNHGTLAVGPTVAEAFIRVYALERACNMQVRMSGRQLHLPQPGVSTRVASQFAHPDFGGVVVKQLAWPALLRMLARRDRSYAT